MILSLPFAIAVLLSCSNGGNSDTVDTVEAKDTGEGDTGSAKVDDPCFMAAPPPNDISYIARIQSTCNAQKADELAVLSLISGDEEAIWRTQKIEAFEAVSDEVIGELTVAGESNLLLAMLSNADVVQLNVVGSGFLEDGSVACQSGLPVFRDGVGETEQCFLAKDPNEGRDARASLPVIPVDNVFDYCAPAQSAATSTAIAAIAAIADYVPAGHRSPC